MARQMKDSGVEWMGEIPCAWDTQKVKFLFAIKKRIAGEEGHTVLSITQKGIVPKNLDSNEGQMAQNYSNYQLVHVGDFAMNHMDLLTGWVDISPHEGVTSPDYRVFVANYPDFIDPRFYLYLFQNCYANRIFYGMGQGVSGLGRWRLPAEQFLNFRVPYPVPQEQLSISTVLDVKCAEIDKVVEQTRATIEEYKKLKQAIITEAVTKGVRGARPMKPSGVEWIGDIPEEWSKVAIKYICRMSAGDTLSSNQISSFGNYPVYGGNGIRGYYSKTNCEGPILLIGRQGALCGNVHRVKQEVWVTEHAIKTVFSQDICIDFGYYLLLSMNLGQYVSSSAAQPGLAVSRISSVVAPIPDEEEQQEIAAYLDAKCAEIDRIIEKKEQLIAELGSYKKSLIYEYVTGKKEVEGRNMEQKVPCSN